MATDRPLIRVRERGFLDLFDLAFVVIRRRPRALAVASLAGVLPWAALNGWLLSDPEFPLAVYPFLLVMEAPWASAPLTVVLGGLMFGERPTAGRVAAAVARALPGLVLYQVVARGLLLVSVLFYPLVPSRLLFLNEVLLLERGRARSAGRRGAALCGPRGSDFFARWLAELVFGLAFVVCFWAGTGAILRTLTSNELTWESPGWKSFYSPRCQVGVWLAVLFFAVTRFLTYIDQRIRLEGWEVKLRLQAVGRSLEESSRW